MPEQKINKVFVYGTLKEGYHNHEYVFKDSVIAVKRAVIFGYEMYDLGKYPGIIRSLNQENKITGQLITIQKNCIIDVIELMDKYEDFDPLHPEKSFYIRKIVKAMLLDTKDYYPAWVYTINVPVEGLKRIENGIWGYRR